MDLRALALLAALLFAGCASEPTPGPQRVGEAEAPAEPEEPPQETTMGSSEPAEPEARQSRDRARVTLEPVEWEGATDELVCVNSAGGCAGFIINHEDRGTVPVNGKVWRVTLTVTWDAVDDATRELSVKFGRSEATGPSPLTVVSAYYGEDDAKFIAHVQGIEEGLVVHLPSQPFHARAVYNEGAGA